MHKLSHKERVVMELLVSGGDAYGLELVERSQGELKRGTVYVTLGRMEEKGLLRSKDDAKPSSHAGLPRRRYSPTALGRRLLAAHEAFDAAVQGVRGRR